MEKSVRPPDATIDALRNCLKWIDWCRDAGWRDEDLPELESLWWKYHDKEGKKK